MRTRRALPPAKRSLGQNFLVNMGVRDRIVAAAAPTSDDWVVELGPGPGALTDPLTARAGRVVAVELDRDLAAALPGRVARPEALEVVVADGAHLDYEALASRAGRRLVVVGNLPFNAASAILRRALDQVGVLARLVLMFQKEVAQRLVAAPGSRTYGLLTVVTAQRAVARRLFDVSPGSFRPRPNVAASVVRLEPVTAPLPPCCLSVHDALVRAVFAQRRKTLRNGLSGAPWPSALREAVFEQEGVSLSARAETISPETYRAVAERLCQASGGHQPRSDTPWARTDGAADTGGRSPADAG